MYKRLLFASLVAAGVAAVSGGHAQAQMACGERTAIVAKLGKDYGEVRRGGGLAGSSAVFELWASQQTGTWTLLRTGTDGVACVMAVGNGWQDEIGAAVLPSGDPA